MNAIDTNVWLYSHDTRDAHKQAVAQSLIANLRSLALPWQVGCEFIAASRKLAPLGFDAGQAWAALADMQSMADAVLMPVPRLWPAAGLSFRWFVVWFRFCESNKLFVTTLKAHHVCGKRAPLIP
jgi:hypothetical protein